MKEPGIIELNPNQQQTENSNLKSEHKTKENIINFELFKKYQIIVVTC